VDFRKGANVSEEITSSKFSPDTLIPTSQYARSHNLQDHVGAYVIIKMIVNNRK
jgi:hypothetical protein